MPLFYTGIAWFIAIYIQGKKIKGYISADGRAFSIVHCLGVSMIWAAITMLPLIGYAYVADPMFDASKSSYGQLQHEIYFQKRNISYSEVDKVADALTQSDYFGQDYQRFIFLEKEDDKYIVSIFREDDCLNNQETVNYLDNVRLYVEQFFPENKLVFNLCAEEVTKIRKVLQ